MSYNILIKVYGHVWPIAPHSLEALRPYFTDTEHMAIEEMLVYENDMLRLAYEGMYLDMEEVLTTLRPFLQKDSQGKIDYIDLEAWTLTRHRIEQGLMTVSTASLNAVMDYSGH